MFIFYTNTFLTIQVVYAVMMHSELQWTMNNNVSKIKEQLTPQILSLFTHRHLKTKKVFACLFS